jgi:hypothetical protein
LPVISAVLWCAGRRAHPDAGAAQIMVLADGVLAHGVRRPDVHPAPAVKPLAEVVRDQRAG